MSFDELTRTEDVLNGSQIDLASEKVADPKVSDVKPNVHERLPRGTRTTCRLECALEMFGNEHLLDQTALDPEVHKRQQTLIHRRIKRIIKIKLQTAQQEMKPSKKFGRSELGYFEPLAEQELRERLRFVTIIHSVTSLNPDDALRDIVVFKKELDKYFKMISGIKLFGVIEPEIVNIQFSEALNNRETKIQAITDEDGEIFNVDEIKNQEEQDVKEHRKLINIKKLAEHLDQKYIVGQSGQLLIHFHGILLVEDEKSILKLNAALKLNKSWSKVDRQIQIKPLSEVYLGSHKSVSRSLSNIVRYITKGGIPLIKGVSYLKYNADVGSDFELKCDLANDDILDSTDGISLMESGNVKGLITKYLSHYEINSLAVLLDCMMGLKKQRMGHVVSIKTKTSVH